MSTLFKKGTAWPCLLKLHMGALMVVMVMVVVVVMVVVAMVVVVVMVVVAVVMGAEETDLYRMLRGTMPCEALSQALSWEKKT